MNRELQAVTLGVALGHADARIGEVGGNNTGPKVSEYLANTDPPIHVAAPWCAAAVQYWSDVAASRLQVQNPLDEVRLEALVQSYWDSFAHREISASQARAGDLVLFKFDGSETWNHIGLVCHAPSVGTTLFTTVEGNTSSESERDGDSVAVKVRDLMGGYGLTFLDWSERTE